MPLPVPPLRYQVPQAPHIRYESRTDPMRQLWLHFSCDGCQDHTQKPCSDMRRSGHWLRTYAGLHHQHRTR